MVTQKNVFISYSQKDSDYFGVFSEGLTAHLLTSNKFDFGVWDDSKALPGSVWSEEIQRNISLADVAILCVSANFLDSTYIEENQFRILIEKFPTTLIVPVYFKHCNIDAWDDLSQRQFFKPPGAKYGLANREVLAFCDLVNFSPERQPIPNPNIDLYLKDFVATLEAAFLEKVTSKNKPIFSPPILTDIPHSLIPRPTNLFTGRKKELEDFVQRFQVGNIFCLAGLGGTGKSEFAARFIETLVQKNVVWFECKNDSLFESLIESAGYYDLLKIENRERIATFLGFKELIERDEKIIFLDNYHNINGEQGEQFEYFFRYLKNSLSKAKFIFISREKVFIDDIDIAYFPLEGLKDDSVEYAKKIIQKNYSETIVISDERLKIICDDLLGHPFAIQLSVQLLSYEGNDYDILEIIKGYGAEKDKLSNRLLDEIFNHPKSTAEEKDLLKKISIFREKIAKKAIEVVYGIQYKEPLKVLINKMMASQVEGDYVLHPLVREFSYLKLQEKTEAHQLALDYYLNICPLSFDLSTQEEIFYHFQKAENYLHYVKYLEINADTCLAYGYTNLIRSNIELLFSKGFKTQKLVIILTDIFVYLKDSPKHSLQIIKEAFTLPLQSEEILLEAKITELEILTSMSEVDDIPGKFNELLIECNTLKFDKGRSVCLARIGAFYTHHDNPQKGEISLIDAVKISKEVKYYHGIQLSLSILGYNYYVQRKYQKAYDLYLEKFNYANEVNNTVDKNKALNGFALVHSGKEEYGKALDIFMELLESNIEIGDKYNQASDYYNIADTLRRQEKPYITELDKSLTISRELSDNHGISRCSRLFGLYYFDNEQYEEGIKSHLDSIGFCNKGKHTSIENTLQDLFRVKNIIGPAEYLKLINSCYDNVSDDIKDYIDLAEIQFKPIVTEKTPGRNDPCPCGSGKKYKHCHGKEK